MITAYTSTKTAIEALKAGAYDYVSKPFDVEELKHVVGKALERKRLADENVALRTPDRGAARRSAPSSASRAGCARSSTWSSGSGGRRPPS